MLLLSTNGLPEAVNVPSFEETMEWLQSKVNGSAPGCHNYELTMRSSITRWSKCRMDVHEQWGISRPYQEANYSVPFGDIDPDSVRVAENFLGCSGITMATTNAKKSIARSPGEMTDRIVLFFHKAGDRDMSRRVIKALRYAVMRCGGASELF